MTTRRKFLKLSALGALVPAIGFARSKDEKPVIRSKDPVVISTWNHGLAANKAAWRVLVAQGRALDAVEKGVRVTESDAENLSVGLGGLPDREGIVTLDACIMDETGNCGGVAFLQDIENPISVARKVMEDTPHVLIVGEGAKRFALEKGFEETNLLTEKAERQWKDWLQESKYKPIINIENHDTIGMLALDSDGNVSGACTTSGLAYKRHGRVGDSPIIGAGLFVDNEIGGACATGVGEEVIKVAGSHLVVELMRQGMEPEYACKEAVGRILKKKKSTDDIQVGFLALRIDGKYGGFSIAKGFNYAVTNVNMNRMVDARFAR